MGLFSFPKTNRLLKRVEFVRLQEIGKKTYTKYFIANFCPGEREKIRLGITVSKKVGNAFVRNRIKRIVREYFRQNSHKIKGKWDINIIAKKESASIFPSNILVMSLEELFYKISREF
ncbi:MAG: ribonuclease P protein component [Desulfobacterales bacterium]|nr:ribonuclease P protein component [Desulfobacterales bacterium]